MHKNPHIGINGVTDKLVLSKLSNSKNNEENPEEFEVEEHLSNDGSEFNSINNLFGNLANDISADKTTAWKGVLCSPFDCRYSHLIMKSHIWPGANAVVNKLYVTFKCIL